MDVAALTTAIATAAGVILPAIKKAWNGDGTGHANTAMQFIPALTSCLNAFANGGPRRYDCNCDETSILRSRIATLEAEKYSDNAAKAESDRLLVKYLKPYGQEIADSRVREAYMKGEIECLKKTQELEQKLAQKDLELARQDAKCCCEKNAMRLLRSRLVWVRLRSLSFRILHLARVGVTLRLLRRRQRRPQANLHPAGIPFS